MRHYLLSFFVFVLSCALGLTLSIKNPIENDESYSQHQSVQNISYIDILRGKVNEGNNAPLFYTLQKALGQITSFQFKTAWVQEQYVCETYSQIWMRLLPVVFMALSLTLCFYYFLKRFNIYAALLSLCLFLTSTPTWIYWTQDRPYSLWILLTCAQTLLLLEYFIFKNHSKSFWLKLTLTHWLLCLCSGFGLIQTLLTLVFIRKKFFIPFILPIVIGIFYAMHAPRYPFRLPDQWLGLILTNVSIENILFLGVGTFIMRRVLPLTLWISVLLGFSGLLILSVYLQHTTNNAGFELSARYLLFLMPTGIIFFNVIWQQLFNASKEVWSKIALYQVLVFVLMMGGWRTLVVLQRLW